MGVNMEYSHEIFKEIIVYFSLIFKFSFYREILGTVRFVVNKVAVSVQIFLPSSLPSIHPSVHPINVSPGDRATNEKGGHSPSQSLQSRRWAKTHRIQILGHEMALWYFSPRMHVVGGFFSHCHCWGLTATTH